MPSRHGFALVIALGLMAFVLLLLLSITTLVRVETTASSQTKDILEAQSTASMALMIALGELQETMGPDRRISAQATLLASDDGGPVNNVAGAWRSWEDDTQTNYATEKQSRFLQWLFSHPDPSKVTDYNYPKTASDSGSISMIPGGDYSSKAWLVATDAPSPTSKDSNTSYAWLVVGENSKAKVATVSRENDRGSENHMIEVQAENTVPSTPDPRGISDKWINFPAGTTESLKALNENSLQLVDADLTKDDLIEAKPHLTVHSEGLLIDVQRSGFKQDLNLLLDKSPLPPHLAGQKIVQGHTTWEYLQDYCNLYKTNNYAGNQFSAPFHSPARTAQPEFSNEVRRSPVIARVQWIFSYSAVRQPGSTDEEDKLYAALVICPVVTLWNPYNTTITTPDWDIDVIELPFAFDFSTGNTQTGWVTFDQIMSSGRSKIWINSSNATDLKFRPGESKVFSPTGNPLNGGETIHLQLGYRNTGGWRYEHLTQTGQRIEISSDETISAALKPSDAASNPQLSLDAYFGSSWVWALRMVFDQTRLSELVDGFGHDDTPNLRAGDVLNTPGVFSSINFQVKTTRDSKFPTLGTLQSSPIQVATEIGKFTNAQWQPESHHPASSTYDLISYAHSDWADSLLPNITPNSNGFVASGATANTGVTHAVAFEFPVKPLQSLVELQHVDFHGVDPVPPYTTNSFGNSMASPLLPSHQNQSSVESNHWYQTDLSYRLNDVFFDHYYFSSIAPRDSTWAQAPSESLQEVYSKHMTGDKPLPNSRYKPYGDTSASDVTQADSYATVASKLMVDGMFNVNSTSKEAWFTLLASLSQDKVLFYNPYDASVVIQQKDFDSEKFIVSRFSIPAGGSADEDTPEPDQIPEELYWRGYRTLTRDQLEALAESIADQVRERGPFLSLSEFTNRQLLSTSSDLTNQGAIQQAIDDCSEDLNQELKDFSVEITHATLTDNNLNYANPEAALGYSAYGAPGWITQADILRPIAPYITVRDDTFRIIAYGEVKDITGNVVARAQCEAIVQRYPEYIEHTDNDDSDASNGNAPTESLYLADGTTDASFDINSVNGQFGRRFKIKSFRWLSHSEIASN